jgi:molybdopterin synthase catalytic subunit
MSSGSTGLSTAGTSTAGTSTAGTSTAGTSTAGTSTAGTSTAGTSAAGTSTAGTSTAGASAGIVSKVKIAAVTEQPLDLGAHAEAVNHRSAGADVIFTGVVRDHDHDRSVAELEYSCHPSAPDVLAAVAEEIAAFPDVIAVAVSHRIGQLQVGDVALVAAVSCAHRGAAFQRCAQLVDEVKARLPVWKRQVFIDGTDEWVNCP